MDSSTAMVVCLNPTLQKTLVFDSLSSGEVNRARHLRLDASGKGVNVARVLGQLGHRVRHLTQLGGIFKPLFTELCAEDSVELLSVVTDADIRFCTTAISLAEGSATELVEPGEAVDAATVDRVREAFTAGLDNCGLLIISGSKAPGFPDELYPWMVGEAKRAGCRVILDYRGTELSASLIHRPDIVKINREEMLQTFGGHGDEIFADLFRNYGVRLVVTDGSAPVRYWEGQGVGYARPPRIKSINPIGSGDAFTAGMASVLLKESGVPRRQPGGEPAAGAGGQERDKPIPLAAMIAEAIRCGAENAMRLKPGCIVSEPGYSGPNQGSGIRRHLPRSKS